jgi:hypothetical protein
VLFHRYTAARQHGPLRLVPDCGLR